MIRKIKYYKYLPKLFFLFLVAVSPFVFWPGVKIPFEVPKVWFVSRVIELIGISGLLFAFTLKKSRFDKALLYLVLLYFVVTIVSSFTGVDFYKSWLGNYFRADGLITLNHFLILFLFLLLYLDKSWIKDIFKAIAYSNFLLSSWTVLNFVLGFPGRPFIASWDGAVGVNFGNPNFLAGYFLVTLPLIFYQAKSDKRVLFKIAFVVQLVALVFTQSWAGILGATIYISYLIVDRFKNYKVVILTALLFIIVFVLFVRSFVNTYKNGVLVAESRQRIITKGLLAFEKRPILGWGWANFDHAFDSVDWPIKVYNDVYVDKAHSTLLETLVTTGFVGLVVYIVILVRVGSNLYFAKSKYGKYLFTAFILYVIQSQTNITSISEDIIFWTMAGIAVKRQQSIQSI